MNYEKLPLIPEAFYNSETGTPFSSCLMCECDLMSQRQPYTIERAIRHYPEMRLESVVFEYAMCARCMANMEKDLSDETKLAIMQYFSAHFNHADRPVWAPETEEFEPEDARSEHLILPEPLDVTEWISTCAIKALPMSQLHEYTVVARCIGDRIIPEIAPYMISGAAQDELVELFSNKSLGLLDDFTDRYFSGPPELKELFKGRPVLV